MLDSLVEAIVRSTLYCPTLSRLETEVALVGTVGRPVDAGLAGPRSVLKSGYCRVRPGVRGPAASTQMVGDALKCEDGVFNVRSWRCKRRKNGQSDAPRLEVQGWLVA